MFESWAGIDAQPSLNPGEVQVWRVSLSSLGTGSGGSPAATAALERAADLLSGDERTRALRMRQGMGRDEFILGRAYLRMLLGRCVDRAPEALTIVADPDGKPRLAEGSPRSVGGHELSFNVAHSRGLILIAVSRAGAVGLDVEWINPAVEVLEIAAEAMHPLEWQQLAAAPTMACRQETFFRCWARKEAVLKADGRGLRLPLASVCVTSDAPGERAVELARDGRPVTYQVRDLSAAPGYAAALALTVPGVHVSLLTAACGTRKTLHERDPGATICASVSAL